MSTAAPVRPPAQNSFTHRGQIQAWEIESNSRRVKEVLLRRPQVAPAEQGVGRSVSIEAPLRPPAQNSVTRRGWPQTLRIRWAITHEGFRIQEMKKRARQATPETPEEPTGLRGVARRGAPPMSASESPERTPAGGGELSEFTSESEGVP